MEKTKKMKTEVTKKHKTHQTLTQVAIPTYKLGFFHLSTRDILGQIIFCLGGLSSLYCTIFSSILGVYPLYNSSIPLTQFDTKVYTLPNVLWEGCTYISLYIDICMYICTYIHAYVSVTSHLYLPGTFNFMKYFVNFQI